MHEAFYGAATVYSRESQSKDDASISQSESISLKCFPTSIGCKQVTGFRYQFVPAEILVIHGGGVTINRMSHEHMQKTAKMQIRLAKLSSHISLNLKPPRRLHSNPFTYREQSQP